MEVSPSELQFMGTCVDGPYIPCGHETDVVYIYACPGNILGVCEACHKGLQKVINFTNQ